MLAWLKTAAGVTKAFCLAHGPVGLVIGGLIVGGCAIVSAIKSSKKESNLEEHVEELEKIKEELKSEETTTSRRKELKKAKKKEVRACARCFLRKWGKVILLFVISCALIIGGFTWEAGRLSATSTALAGACATLNTVDSNIRSVYGDEGVAIFHDRDFDSEKFKEAVKSSYAPAEEANGTVRPGYDDPIRKYYDNGYSLKINNVPGDWTIRWDSSSAAYKFWTDDPVLAIQRCAGFQWALNEKLKSPFCRALTMNEAYDECGLFDEKSAAGNNVGWVKGETVDLGIGDYIAILDEVYVSRANGVPSAYEGTLEDIRKHGILLHFNPGGPIMDAAYKGRAH